MTIRSIPSFHLNPPKRGSSRSSWKEERVIGGRINLFGATIDLDNLVKRFGEERACQEIQSRFDQVGVKVGVGFRSILGQKFDIRGLAQGAREEFGAGTVPRSKTRPKKIEREPVVDIFDEDKMVKVLAEMPGVEEKDIHFELRNRTLVLFAENPSRRYSAEVELPAEVKVEPRFELRNGILNLSFEKA